jgi:ArsR family transcriptional regulator
MNMKMEKKIADLMKVLSAPFRIRLLYAIGTGEACVCHLVQMLEKRQAYISQQLTLLRDAGVLETRREGKYVYYRVADPAIFTLVDGAAGVLGMDKGVLPELGAPQIDPDCPCPKCDSEMNEMEK